MSDSTQLNRSAIRKSIRAKRRSLSPTQQHQASLKLCVQLRKSRLSYRARHVALYLANDGEISPKYIYELLQARGIKCYLPILHPLAHNKLLFCEYNERTQLKQNRFGIPEPCLRKSRTLNARHLSLVLLPLVAFDAQGNRMGMGGGFYDRTFAYKHQYKSAKPKLLGLAHECQKVDKLPVESWDIPLFGIVTDKKLYLGSGASARHEKTA